jgi:nitrous oxidase accessory protein NosD
MALVAAAPSASTAVATTVDCSTTNLQTSIDDAAPGATLVVTGTCSGNFTVDETLTLLGRGTAVLNGEHGGSTLTVASGATVRGAGLTFTDGSAPGIGDGGGINNSGTLSLEDSLVTNNSAGSYGGGIYNSGALTLKGTTVNGNSSMVFGGGIYNNGAMTLQDSSVSDNSAELAGGGIFSGYGFDPVTLQDSSISNNTVTAGSGGGIFNILDSETLQNTRVSGNTASLEGGGIVNNAGTTTLVDSTVTNNSIVTNTTTSVGGAGGIFDFSGTVPMRNSTVSGNIPDNCDPPGYVASCTG